MKHTWQTVILLAAGLVVGGLATHVFLDSSGGNGSRGGSRTAILKEERGASPQASDDVSALLAEIERLKALLAAKEKPADEAFPDDTPEKVEQLLQDAYADTNVDWLIEAIRRLLRMGERGYPILRKMIEDIIFRGKFLPTQNDFRVDHIYKLGRLFTEEEKKVIGFLNYLIVDAGTLPIFKQVAMMGAAYYVGSNAAGADMLQETLVNEFLAKQGMQMPGGMMGGEMGKQMARQMQIFAMAMSGDQRMIAPLHDELSRTKDPRQQGDILGALAYLGDPTAVPLIKERLNPAEGDFGREIDALGRAGTEEAQRTASEFLKAIPDSKRFYGHARRYMRAGGGNEAVMLMKERITRDPQDPEVASSIGALRRYPTKDSRDTLVLIRDSTKDPEVKKRAGEAADEVDMKLRGEIPPAFRGTE